MPGANCALYGCGISRRSNLPLFKKPFFARGDGDETVKLKSDARKKWLRVILRTQENTPDLKKRIDANNIFLCEMHFKPELIYQRKYLNLFIVFVFEQIYGN